MADDKKVEGVVQKGKRALEQQIAADKFEKQPPAPVGSAAGAAHAGETRNLQETLLQAGRQDLLHSGQWIEGLSDRTRPALAPKLLQATPPYTALPTQPVDTTARDRLSALIQRETREVVTRLAKDEEKFFWFIAARDSHLSNKLNDYKSGKLDSLSETEVRGLKQWYQQYRTLEYKSKLDELTKRKAIAAQELSPIEALDQILARFQKLKELEADLAHKAAQAKLRPKDPDLKPQGETPNLSISLAEAQARAKSLAPHRSLINYLRGEANAPRLADKVEGKSQELFTKAELKELAGHVERYIEKHGRRILAEAVQGTLTSLARALRHIL